MVNVIGNMYDFLQAKRGLQESIICQTGREENPLIIRSGYFNKLFNMVLLASIVGLIAGCQHNPGPRLRLGAYFGAPVGIHFPAPDNLGKHEYRKGWSEQIGMVYTCRGGFIDLGHLRESADRTRYLSKLTLENMIKGKKKFSFRVIEPSRYFVKLTYPENWHQLPNKEEIATETAIRLGQYFAYLSTVWHEIITWYGYTCTFVFSEYISSFSLEDIYSDLVGTHLGARALRDPANRYDDAMTMLINEELKKLEVQPSRIGIQAIKTVEGSWYTGGLYFFVAVRKRSFDTGSDDGFVTPWLVPGMCSDAEALPSPIPNLDFLDDYGISMELEIEPRFSDKDKILRIAYPDGDGKRINPKVHFSEILEDVKNRAIIKYGPEVDMPTL
jgi:hypothetical protein